MTLRIGRRSFQAGVATSLLAAGLARPAHAFGEVGAFHPRILLTGSAEWKGIRTSAPAQWSLDLQERTSAPARLSPGVVRPDMPELLAEPFAIWAGSDAPEPLTSREAQGLRRFFAMGGVLFVDDFEPTVRVDGESRTTTEKQADKLGVHGRFARAAMRELSRVLPDTAPIAIDKTNVVFRSFYLIKSAVGRVEGPATFGAMIRGGAVQVIISSHDLLGALARGTGGTYLLDVEPGGAGQREMALRMAINIAMYVLCSNYKDDQVHAEHLMRRRGAGR